MPTFTSWATTRALTAYRTTKFKQRRQIMTRFRHLPHVQVGGCTGLTFGWLQRHRRSPSEGGTARLAVLNTDQHWNHIDYLASVFNSRAAGKSYADRIATVAKHSLGMKAGEMCEHTSAKDFSAVIHHLDNHPGYHAALMVLGGANTNHICAAVQRSSDLVFFDPNSGEYTVKNEHREGFFTALYAQYRTYVSSTGARRNITIDKLIFLQLI